MPRETQIEAAVAQVVVGRDAEDLKKFGTRGAIYLGKHLVGTGEDAHLTTPMLLDVLRPHCVVLCGKRGEGKCLEPNALVHMADGSLKRIEDIFRVVKESDDSEEDFMGCNKGIEVLSLGSNLQIEQKSISHVYRKKVSEKLVRIKTSGGKEIKCTKEHPLLALNSFGDNNLVYVQWIRADCLSVGIKIAALAFSDICWENILELEEIDYEGYVYDLTVPETHNFIAGTNGGIVCHNSFTLGVLAEELKKLPENVKKNLCGLMIDTQGIFWTMKYPNEKEMTLLADWEMKPSGFDVSVYVPEGQEKTFREADVEFDGVFSIAASELSVDDWMSVFDLDPNQPLGILLQRSINKLLGTGFSLDGIIAQIKTEEGFENEKLALENRFEAAKTWGVFGESRMPVILEPGKITIIDVSLTPQSMRSLLIALVSRKIFAERTKARRSEELAETEGVFIKRVPLCWVMIDEAHNFIPDEGNPVSAEVLIKLVREGRQPGISLVLATQRPEKLNPDVLAQCDMIISHRLTSKADIDALRSIMQTYMLYDVAKYINELPKLKGVCLILDDNSERLYTARVRPRQSWHAGSSPVAI